MIENNKIQWVIDLINKLVDNKHTGSIQINFQFGGITNINKVECIKAPEKGNRDETIKL